MLTGSGRVRVHGPRGVAVHDGELYVTEAHNNRLHVFSIGEAGCSFKRIIGSRGAAPGQLAIRPIFRKFCKLLVNFPVFCKLSGNFSEFSFHPRDHLFWGNKDDLIENLLLLWYHKELEKE